MLARTSGVTSGVCNITRSSAARQLWRQAPRRRYAVDSTNEPEWFQPLRAEMLSRDITYLHEDIVAEPENRLAHTLSGFLPSKWCTPPTTNHPNVTPGHHLIWFNPALPADQMLPDGTDASQSPGGPWVRRMWAGGSITLRPDQYYHSSGGFNIGSAVAGVERIKDVRLRGQGDAAKLFVTIERRFTRVDQAYRSYRMNRSRAASRRLVAEYLKQQLRDNEEWDDALLKEERELVFFKERPAAELEAIKAGQMAPVKYLDRPSEPELSIALTPTRSLLFRFSALTFNAHLIHLDPEYARNVEGHRNLLVHGPLSLTLMMHAISKHVSTAYPSRVVVERIDYRNLAPLYCDEEMRICATKKNTTDTGSTYDVWIEGPTGGVAVRGTVQTVARMSEYRDSQRKKAMRSEKRSKSQTGKSREGKAITPVRSTPPGEVITTSETQSSNLLPTSGDAAPAKLHRLTVQEDTTTHNSIMESTTPTLLPVPGSIVTADTCLFSVHLDAQDGQADVQDPKSFDGPHPYNKRTRTRSYRFLDPVLPLRQVRSHRPFRPSISPSSRYFIRRLTKRKTEKTSVAPIPIIRTYGASPYEAASYARFRKDGVRKVGAASIRMLVSPSDPGY
ncbi:hypothetical protein T440DRAFT_486884 [Plenodomus tracheiphilus IPT5]|uniref:Thioesterase/thiol ester dehydrase-isomerase n=1 Tax=Plenodomus tracheiphilus IPT5 TaxID=1408161 RepID=A0A6A7BFS6_9PLEO|nr:hypothetical protein T440DRAFT_486884 [Plenodomus tracheiphilus IPT5]